jgi:DNA topoisomerase-1
MPKRRARKGEAEEKTTGTVCHFEKKIGPPKSKEAPPELERPDPEKTRPLVEALA